MASSELSRTYRHAVMPHHLLYVGMKIIGLRVRNLLNVAYKFIGKDTHIIRQQIESEEYINSCIKSNHAFLKSTPNSAYYLSQRKRNLFAIIWQEGTPTGFLTRSVNEVGWPDLMKLLYKLRHNGTEISDENLSELCYMDKSTVINEDSVTPAIFLNKLVNVILKI